MKTFAERKWGNCDKAVAYCLNFTRLCYGYDSDGWWDYFKKVCEHCEHNELQHRDYECPAIDFSKKDFMRLDIYEPIVSEKLMKDMLAFGVPADCFRPVYTRKHIITAYQITPTQTLTEFANLNGYNVVEECRYCGHRVYELDDRMCFSDANKGFGYPLYISEQALSELDIIARAFNGDIIIPLELYNYLLEKYPKIECMPVFLGNVYNDDEYLRVHNISEDKTDKMTFYSLLEHYSTNGNSKELGVFKAEKISDIVKEYSTQQGFNEPGSLFCANKSCFIDDKKQNRVYCLYIWHGENIPPWDDELDDYDYDVCLPDFHNIYRNRATAEHKLKRYIKQHNLSEDDVVYSIDHCPINIKYWDGGFFSIC